MSDTIVMIGVIVVIGIASLIGIWNNWSFLGLDGFSLPEKLTPNFWQFYFNYLPRRLVGLTTRWDQNLLGHGRRLSMEESYFWRQSLRQRLTISPWAELRPLRDIDA